MKTTFFFSLLLIFFSCRNSAGNGSEQDFDNIAKDYVKLGLSIGVYDSDFVDAYYGPDSLRPATSKQSVFPKYIFLNSIKDLEARLLKYTDDKESASLAVRAKWMTAQLKAFSRRVKIFSGERKTFDEESRDLFGVTAPSYPESYFKALVAEMNAALPGEGTAAEKFQHLANMFIIPKDKIDTVFKTAIAEARKRTLAHYSLPAQENFTLEYVTNKPWSGYNWYKGNYQSDIQINTDLQIFIERAIDVASHESYPGHHVYNMLLEKNLYKEKGWVEVSLYPLFSPQSLIAEGSANYGIEVAFPGREKNDFMSEHLLPLTGLDTTGISLYMRALELKSRMSFVRNEVGRGIINGSMTDTAAVRWLMDYGFSNKESALKSLSFIKKYGSYVINYNYGQQLVKHYIELNGGDDSNHKKRWALFGDLLSNEITAADLMK